MRITPQTDLRSVVVVGTFSPKIFHPMWFSARELIGAKEAEEARIGVLHDEITNFTTGKLTVDVQLDRFAASSTILPDAPRDLVLGTFGQHLPGTPLRAMGINRTVHFDTGSPAVQHDIGVRLAPRDPWGEWGRRLAAADGTDRRGGLISLKMQQNRDEGEPTGYIQVRIEPSGRIRGTGIFMEINNHYAIKDGSPIAADASEILSLLSNEWERANACAEGIIDQIMALVPNET